jgi:methylated-DNA-[protein]-cysteine S-methyltransferase
MFHRTGWLVPCALKGKTMKQINFQYFHFPLGELILASFNGKLCLCDWRYRKMRDCIDRKIEYGLQGKFVKSNDAILEESKQQLNEYYNAKRENFTIPLNMVGTEFQQRVWNALLAIPFGETLSYLQLATSMGNKNAVRAVANANGANSISIFIPCHRVIGHTGKLVGYAGGLNAKKKLLMMEGLAAKVRHENRRIF